MTSTLIQEVAQLLEGYGLGVYTANSGRNIFVGNLPDGPDFAIAIFETRGLNADIDIPLHYPSFQIMIRHTRLDLGQTVVKRIRDILHNQYNVQFVTNGTYIYSCNLQGEGGHIGRDERGRDQFSLNFQCNVR